MAGTVTPSRRPSGAYGCSRRGPQVVGRNTYPLHNDARGTSPFPPNLNMPRGSLWGGMRGPAHGGPAQSGAVRGVGWSGCRQDQKPKRDRLCPDGLFLPVRAQSVPPAEKPASGTPDTQNRQDGAESVTDSAEEKGVAGHRFAGEGTGGLTESVISSGVERSFDKLRMTFCRQDQGLKILDAALAAADFEQGPHDGAHHIAKEPVGDDAEEPVVVPAVTAGQLQMRRRVALPGGFPDRAD